MKGGTREGAGRPKGSLNKATLEKKKVEEAFTQRVLNAADRLFNAQVSIAEGCSYLYRIDEIGEGSKKREEHVLVTDPEEIKRYLDGDTEGNYYITTKTPDNKAIDSLLDRALGKAITKIAGTGDNGEITVSLTNYGANGSIQLPAQTLPTTPPPSS